MKCPACGHSPAWTKCWHCGWTKPHGPPPDEWDMTFPLPPNMANDLAAKHWAVARRRKRGWTLLTDSWAETSLPSYEDPVRLDATLYLWNRMDSDNLVARLKWIQDWLVDRRVIVDDHPDALVLGEISQEIDRKAQRVEVTLTRLETT